MLTVYICATIIFVPLWCWWFIRCLNSDLQFGAYMFRTMAPVSVHMFMGFMLMSYELIYGL